jgi:hypothetical protein
VTVISRQSKGEKSKKTTKPKTKLKKGRDKDTQYEMYKKNGKLYYRRLNKSQKDFSSIFGDDLHVSQPKPKVKKEEKKKEKKKEEKEKIEAPEYDKHFRFKRRKGVHRTFTTKKRIISKPIITKVVTVQEPIVVVKKVSRKKTKLDNILKQGPFCFLHIETNKFLGVSRKNLHKNVTPSYEECNGKNKFSIVENALGENMYNIKKGKLFLGYDDSVAERYIKLYSAKDRQKGEWYN